MGFQQMLRRRHINGDPRGRTARFALGAADLVRWPFERLYWAVEERVVWPLRERTAGWSPPGHVIGAAGLATVAVAAILTGAFLLSGDDPTSEPAATPIAATVPAPQPDQAEEPTEPELKGAPPSFGVGEGVGVTEPTAAEEAEAGESVETGGDVPAGEAAAATSSSAKPVPAGPAAMKVARRFAEAFVFYEVGERPARAATVFGETTTPQLAEALAERPPRQPQSTEVPQARVVNLVPGPRAGKAYTVSVSLLRVGLTSELRLEMQKTQGAWLITDVRG